MLPDNVVTSVPDFLQTTASSCWVMPVMTHEMVVSVPVSTSLLVGNTSENNKVKYQTARYEIIKKSVGYSKISKIICFKLLHVTHLGREELESSHSPPPGSQ